MRIEANGASHEIREGTSVKALVESLNLSPQWVVCELNGEVVERAGLADVVLEEGDRLEIVRAVAGGQPWN
jgi:sulfur carrier protein